MNKEEREEEIKDAINLLISILEDMDYDISRIVEEDNPDYIDTLREMGLTRKKGLVKILGNGEITNSVNLKVHSASELAREKIEKAGGTIEIIEV